MLFNRRKKYNGDVAVLLPEFGFDLEEAGVFKLLNVLDIAWREKYTVYEAALLVANSFGAGLYEAGEIERADEFVENKIIPIQDDWIKKGNVRESLAKSMSDLLQRRAGKAHEQETR